MNGNRIIFVYNANSSLFAKVTDYAWKAISPRSYQCNLCRLTYGNLGIKQQWKDFIKKLSLQISFMHKDDFLAEYPEYHSSQFPAVFEQAGNKITQKISASEINEQKTIADLEKLVLEKTDMTIEPKTKAILTCPNCGAGQPVVMPTTACQYTYTCTNCKAILKPKGQDCCVFCSYADSKCPAKQ